MTALPRQVKIVEVGPRDGLQSEPRSLPTKTRAELVDRLSESGLTAIESGAFVNPRWVPQMAGSDDVFALINRHSNVTYSALAPNLKGYESAVKANVDEIAVFPAASETFSQKNLNCSISESLQRFEPLMAAAKADNIAVRGYISCACGCPYEGSVDSKRVAELAETLLAMGCYEICLADTIGVATPAAFEALITSVKQRIPVQQLAVHCHDTYGQALANIYTALQQGITVIDSAISGLGGCPYAPGASGNVATEDVVYMLNGLNIEHGINLNKLVEAGQFIDQQLERQTMSKAANTLRAKLL